MKDFGLSARWFLE